MDDREQILKQLNFIGQMTPAPFYWMDLNGNFIGLNQYALDAIGAPDKEYVLGKNVYNVYHNKQIADKLQQDISHVIQTGMASVVEDQIIDVTTGKIKYYTATRAPLLDHDGQIFGIIGTSIDITDKKEAELLKLENERLEFENRAHRIRVEEQAKFKKIASQMLQNINSPLGDGISIVEESILNHLDFMVQMAPAPLYIMDLDGRFIGLNDGVLKGMGAPNKEFVLGKTVYEVYNNKEIADKLQEDIDKVIQTGKGSQLEDKVIDATTGKIRYYMATRVPLYDYNKNIIGVIGTSIEITAEKEAEQLRVENEINKKTLETQARFGREVRQMAHDFVSPMSTLTDAIKILGSNIPEDMRVNIRNAVERMAGISQRFISRYDSDADTSDIVSVPLALLQIMNEKREEHRKSGVVFKVKIDDGADFEFIKIDLGMFKRMISNLVNNAVEALKDKADAKVEVEFMSNAGQVLVVVEDNGPGMPKHIQEKVEAGIEITEGKENGHGLGLTQVIDTIKAGGGTYQIHATKEYGTHIYIWFPRIDTPSWLAKEIKLTKDDTVIILDDDTSIHGTWDSRFKPVLAKHPTLKVEHFHHGNEVIKYINNLSPEQKQNVFLLTDYELLDQGINGLDVVAQTEMLRAILVTSYATHKEVQYKILETGIKMLPKELASAASITVDKKIPKWSSNADMVWIEDRKDYVDELVKRYYSHLTVDTYYEPISFLEDVHQYPLDTRIILDTYYETADKVPYILTGFTLAEKLHAMGYTKLILFAGEIPKVKVPEYLHIVLKSDIMSEHPQLDEI